MKIALINPPFLFPSKSEIVFSQCLGMRSLSSYLKSSGNHEVYFIDTLMRGFSNVKKYQNGYIVGLEIDETLSLIPDDVELIGISAPFSQLAPVVHRIAERVKNAFPDTPTVMGGVYPSTQPEIALTSHADFIVLGEGEIPLSEIANNRYPEKIPGVYTNRGRLPKDFTSSTVVKDLDSLPLPDYSIPAIENYFTFSQRMRTGRTASLVTSRGCPFDCEFCSIHPVYGTKYRYKSAAKVLEEIELLVNKYSIRYLEIEDDNFTLKPQRTVEILNGIIRLNEKGAGIAWSTPNGVRIDTLNEEIVKLFKRSNCESIVLALEHGNQDMLNIMNKKLDLEKVYHIMTMLVHHKIPQIVLFVIVGYPGETKERFQSSLNYLKKLRDLGNNVRICVNFAQPYPSTKLTARCLEEGIIKDKEWGNFLVKKELMSTSHFVTITTSDFDANEVRRRKEEILNLFAPKWKVLVKKILPTAGIRYLRDWRRKL